MQLRIPGPTPCPPETLQAMGGQMINHRGEEFAEILQRATAKLKMMFQTRSDVIILTASGTGGLEAAIVNSLSPNDKVLAVSIGVFGDRFADIAKCFGANVNRLQFEWGKAADPDAIRQALNEDPDIKAVLVTHNETSTGVTNDIEALGRVVSEFDKLLIVDAVSGLGSLKMRVDAWHCDVVVTGSQKGWMIPPGLSMLSINQKGWRANSQATMPRFYWDLSKAKDYLKKGQTSWTPAISLFYALDKALSMMEHEGLANITARHARVAEATRRGIEKLGLSLFADKSFASNTVTAVKIPDGINVSELRQVLKDDYGVVVAGGQRHLANKIFRIGHLGWVTEADIKETLTALEKTLTKLGFNS
ncbi:MAG: alanine--glyoxylate aminotransferase family protein [Dehalococcoidia bacterium]|nr:alanine--glyoxylate aminotransferase family protein [Dehalococcoidia bacterium]